MSRRKDDEAAGCAAIVVLALVIGAIVSAVISIAALVDPFAWMPSLAEVWADCEESYDIEGDECALGVRYPGFWLHAIVNLLYFLAIALCLYLLAGAAQRVRTARVTRFAGDEALKRYRDARDSLTAVGVSVAILALIPLVVAVFS